MIGYCLPTTNRRDHSHVEQVWAIPREVLEVKQNNDSANYISNLRGFSEDGFRSFVVVTSSYCYQIQHLEIK